MQNLGWFIERGAMSALLRLGERLGSSIRDRRLYLMLAAAAGVNVGKHASSGWGAAPLGMDLTITRVVPGRVSPTGTLARRW